MRIPLLGGSYEGISTNTSAQECINFYYESPAPGESHLGAMLPVHGATTFNIHGSFFAHRAGGLLYNPIDNLLYAVSGNKFYEIASNTTYTNRATLSSSSGPIEMALNPSINELIIVDGTSGTYFQCTPNTEGTISDADYPDTATTCDFINGYFLVNVPGTPGRFQWSDLNSSTAWTSTNFSTATSVTSDIKKIGVNGIVIYLLGDMNGELWYNSGDSSVFTRFEKIDVGIVSSQTWKQFDNSVVWLSRNKQGELNLIRVGDKYNPQVISTPELSRKWGLLTTVSDAYAYTYQFDGHEFYVLTFPTDSKTYCYDATTKMWSQRSGPFSSSNPTRDMVAAIAFCSQWGGHIVSDYHGTGKLFSLENTIYTWDSVNMERRLTGPTLASMNEDRLRFSEVQIDIEEGTATGSETGNDGQLTFSYSKDNGHTYSTGNQLDIGVGGTAGYKTRLMKRRLGYGRSWIFRIYTDTPRKIIVKGAYGRLYGEPKAGFPQSAVTK